MHKLSAFLLLATLAGGTARSQDASRSLFLSASHCLATPRNWLPPSNSQTNSFDAAYVIDTKSDPGVNHIYVVVYTNKEHSKGKAFDLRYTVSAGKTTICNNAGFTISSGRVIFNEPPLGGTWTQTRLASAIMQAGKKVATVLDPSEFSDSSRHVKCESYVGKK